MALIKCPECQKDVSTEAKVCPHCGKKIKAPWYKSWVFWTITGVIVFIAIMVTIVFVQFNEGKEIARQSDEYKDTQRIIDDSKKASSRAESSLEELEEIQDQLDQLDYYLNH